MKENDIRSSSRAIVAKDLEERVIMDKDDVSFISNIEKSRIIELFLLGLNTSMPVLTHNFELDKLEIVSDPHDLLKILKSFLKNEFNLENMKIIKNIEGMSFNQIPPGIRNKLSSRKDIHVSILRLDCTEHELELNFKEIKELLNPEEVEREMDNYLDSLNLN